MKRGLLVVMIFLLLVNLTVYSYDDDDRGGRYMRDGFVGAASGVVGSFASGADSSDVWKGALAGMGVSLIGGAIADSMTSKQKKVSTVDKDSALSAENSYSQGYKDGYKQAQEKLKSEQEVK